MSTPRGDYYADYSAPHGAGIEGPYMPPFSLGDEPEEPLTVLEAASAIAMLANALKNIEAQDRTDVEEAISALCGFIRKQAGHK